MRPDDINPRTGLVVALVSVFLVFGFMFTVSGIKGETLGDIPLLAIGPAICLPGIAAIALTRKTDGCTKWPRGAGEPPRSCPTADLCSGCCYRPHKKPKDALELLRTPSDLESGCSKGSSCDELANGKIGTEGPTGAAIATIAASSSSARALEEKEEEERAMLPGYLEDNCCPERMVVATELDEAEEATPCTSAFLQKSSPVLEKPAVANTTTTIAIIPSIVDAEKDRLSMDTTIIVCSYKEGSPYDRYCCYINPSEEVCSDHEAVV